MKFSDFKSFRDYDRKIFKVYGLDENIKHGLKDPIYGILYIDRECGTTLRIVGDDNTKYEDTMAVVRATAFNNAKFEKFDGDSFTKEVLEQISEVYYDEKLDELLSDKNLDEFRHETFPNDVLAILPSEEQAEKMWVRLIMKTKEKNLYVAELLDDSYNNKNYTTGKKVALVLYEKDDFKGLIINGLVQLAD